MYDMVQTNRNQNYWCPLMLTSRPIRQQSMEGTVWLIRYENSRKRDTDADNKVKSRTRANAEASSTEPTEASATTDMSINEASPTEALTELIEDAALSDKSVLLRVCNCLIGSQSQERRDKARRERDGALQNWSKE